MSIPDADAAADYYSITIFNTPTPTSSLLTLTTTQQSNHTNHVSVNSSRPLNTTTLPRPLLHSIATRSIPPVTHLFLTTNTITTMPFQL
jgi:hypothetical protein